MQCRICHGQAPFFAKGTILGKYEISYFRCSRCGFIQTEQPYWLEESYSKAIARSDVGLVSRNISLTHIAKCLISVFFNRSGKFIDYGGGYGLFVRLMRDAGLDFYYYDSHCENLFASGFEADISAQEQYDLLTAFEVMEHLVDPHEEMKRMLSLSQSIFLSTYLLPQHAPKPSEWWYYGLDHGQHISLYSLQALKLLADQYGMKLYSSGPMHLLTRSKRSKYLFSLCTNNMFAHITSPLFIRRSLLHTDFTKLMKRAG
ncbi:MAG: class I SAM-dependent methyltransferase [Nitrospirae bacterium]|nr:class I SAM-dependent methyltransferase [Nitrospirota bacterium]